MLTTVLPAGLAAFTLGTTFADPSSMTARTPSRSISTAAWVAAALAVAVCIAANCRPSRVYAASSLASPAASAPSAAIAAHSIRPDATPVLVELFTSEGCASCPAADRLLAQLQRTQPIASADILALEEHVDYWDSLGWRDRFSSRTFSTRQDIYGERLRLDSEFTPQMVVDGTQQLVGSDIVHALPAIARAAAAPKLALTLSPLTVDAGHLAGTVSVARPAAARRSAGAYATSVSAAGIYAAIVQPMASTHVLNGDNIGQTLQHDSVVRGLQRIGTLAAATAAPLRFTLSLPTDTPSTTLRVVVFVQSPGQGAILGATSSSAIAAPADNPIAFADIPGE